MQTDTPIILRALFTIDARSSYQSFTTTPPQSFVMANQNRPIRPTGPGQEGAPGTNQGPRWA